MAELLTPVTLWNDFSADADFEPEREEAYAYGDVMIEKLYIKGKTVSGQAVKIFILSAKKKCEGKMPAILLFDDYSVSPDEKTAVAFAKKGYAVFSVDYSGKAEGKKRFTVYPESLDFADYDKVKNNLFSVTDEKKSHFYEWSVSARYALSFVKSLDYIGKVGAVGNKGGAFIVWQLAATDGLSCAAAIYNAGWNTYKKGTRFTGEGDGLMSDNDIMLNAGIEPQSYASHVKCPVLFITATDNIEYDADRAYDTVSRIDNKIYSAVCYFVGKDGMSFAGVKNADIFFTEYLTGNGKPISSGFEAESKIKNGECEIKVKGKDVEKLTLYLSDGETDPALRTWNRITDYKKENDVFTFTFGADRINGRAFFFTSIILKNDFTVCTNITEIINESTDKGKGKVSSLSGVIYSGRDEKDKITFLPFSATPQKPIFPELKKGPMGIEGISAADGIITSKVNECGLKPKKDAILMFDAYSEADAVLTVSYVFDVRNTDVEFSARVKIAGGKVWHNVILEMQKFKTAEGRPLKNYELLNGIKFYSENELLINNVLWI